MAKMPGFESKLNMKKNYRRFNLFRLSLRRRPPDLFENLEVRLSRCDWIKRLFSERVDFQYYGKKYVYIADENQPFSDRILGRLGREICGRENNPPEQGFKPKRHEAWIASRIVVDPTEHHDGQKVAIEDRREVGSPSALASHLLQKLEDVQKVPHYLSAIHPISNDRTFWKWVNQNNEQITRLTFVLEVPNLFGSDEELEKEMQKYRDEENAQKVKIEISNPDGIKTKTERVQYTVDRAMARGTGKVTAQTAAGNYFSSQKNYESVKIQERTDGEINDSDITSDVTERILGRDKD